MADQRPSGQRLNWDELDQRLVREYGSYLHNVRPGAPGVCRVCATPVAGYALCHSCSLTAKTHDRFGPGNRLADRVAFMTYAVEGGQAYSVLRGYKTPAGQGRFWTAAATWTMWFLGRHARLAHQLAHSTRSAWAWATVPSARSGREGDHPLNQIVRRIWDTSQEIPLTISTSAESQRRDYKPHQVRRRYGESGCSRNPG